MNRPSPLRTDGSNEFARFSMQVRVPRIVRDVAARNPDYPTEVRANLEKLAASIESNAPLPCPRPPAPDVPAWQEAHTAHAHETWLDTEWFHAEFAAYREIAAHTRFWETGRDPFAPFKEEELASDSLWARLEAALGIAGFRRARLEALIVEGLWGNRVDLSYGVAAGLHRRDEDLIIDHRSIAAAQLAAAVTVDVIADNTGTELALDLALIDALLEGGSEHVTLHVKLQPVFVSDAIVADVWKLLAGMQDRGGPPRALAARLRRAFEDGRLCFAADPFWNGPRFLWQAPSHIAESLAAAAAVLVKGDANYRRVVGDALWPVETPFSEAISYVGTPIICARTMKSDPIVGLSPHAAADLDATEPRWRIDGRRGIVQVHVPRTEDTTSHARLLHPG